MIRLKWFMSKKIIIFLFIFLSAVLPVLAGDTYEAPDGTWVSGMPHEAPDGTWVGGMPQEAPDGTWVGSDEEEE